MTLKISLKMTIILLIITALLLMGYVWTRLKAVELSYKYAKLITEEKALLEENNRLRLKAASLKSPQRLSDLALQKMNFVKNGDENKIFVKLEPSK